MRFFLATAIACLSFSQTMAQGDQTSAGQCRALQDKTGNRLAFVTYSGATTPVSTNEYDPTVLTAPAVKFHICVPVNPQDRGTLGAVNIKIQVYSTDAASGSSGVRIVEYENNTERYGASLAKYRAKHGTTTYPTIDIADYQNYHGCSRARPNPIDSSFHFQLMDRRTDDDPFRAKFVFRGDFLPTCDMPQLIAEFIEGFPSPGPKVASALGRYDPKVEKIVGRRSVILKYDFRDALPTDIQYLTYDFNRVGKDRCVRVEASYVFDTRYFGSDIVGVACVSSAE
jgi:hypothetical protein